MRLRKRIISALMAACMIVTVLPTGMPLKALAAEITEETTETIPGGLEEEIKMPEVTEVPEGLPEESTEKETVPEDTEDGQPEGDKDGALAQADGDSTETEDGIKISNVTISDTYYSINGKFPMYVEYEATWGNAGMSERNNLKLVVGNGTSTAVAEVQSNNSSNYFSTSECNGIHNGSSLELTFSIIYTKDGVNKTLWSGSKDVSFKDMDFKVYTDYFPIVGTDHEVDVAFLNANSGNSDIYAMYLFDENNKIAAGTKEGYYNNIDSYGSRYGDTFKRTNPDSINKMRWVHKKIDFYRTRKLKAKEKLYLGLRYKEGEEIKTDKTEMVFVTDQPYIESVGFNSSTMNLYTEAGNTSFLNVYGYNNIDFSKVSVELKDEDTGELAGRSISYIKEDNDHAYYCIQWEDGKKPDNYNSYTYNISFSYPDNGTNLISKIGSVNYNNYRNGEAIWNYRADTIEYYNKEIPAGSLVSYELKDENYSSASVCASGSGIKVSDKHLLAINIKDKELNNYSYYLYVTYTDNNGKETTVNEYVYNRQDGEKELPWLYSYGLENPYYLSNDTSINFSAWVYCNDESKLLNECSAKITGYNDSVEIDTIKLSFEKKDNNLFYKGTYNKSLNTGRYHLLFSPDGKTELGYTFYVYNINILPVFYQDNSISSGIISMHIPSSMVAEWYCGENNSKIKEKLTVKILDIEKKEIGTYTAANSDFNIMYNTNSRDMTIQFSESIKQSFSDLYYCYVYLYYNGIEVHSYYSPVESLYKDNKSYGEYIRGDETTSSVYMVKITDNGSMSYGYSGFNFYDNYNFNGVYGTESSFPVKVTVADWYSAEPLKTITVQKSKEVFTEAQLEGLSSDKVYNFFLEGADGTADIVRGYIDSGNYNGDKPKPSSKPTYNPSGGSGSGSYYPSGGSGSIAPYIPPVSNGGNDIQPTTAPTVQPEATTAPTAAPTANPTTAPTSAPTTAPTAAPEATAAPAATAPPEGVKEPEIPIINNPYKPSQEEKPELKFKKNKITLNKGQKAKIKITSKLTTSVTYKSLKPSVATVSKKGVITAKKAGKAVITVKANGLVKKVQVTVKKASKTEDKTESTVKTASSVKLGKDFKLAKASVTLKKGKKLTIKKASGLSGKVTFRSLDKKIASVSVNGVVKAKKKGKTTILIKKGKKTIKLKVVVKK